MADKINKYYYNRQIKKTILQFCAIFTGFQVKVGKSATEDERLISVPVHYATTDRVVAAIKGHNTQNAPLRLPLMAVYMTDMVLDRSRLKGIGVERRTTFTPLGGLVPDDVQVIHQRMPVPYTLTFEVTTYCSNTDQEFQLLEQLLPLFDPFLNIQMSDAPFDWARQTRVELTDVGSNATADVGTALRVLQKTMKFEVPIWIDIPANIRRDFIEQIYLRIGAVSAGSVTSEEIIADLDGQGIDYDLWQDASDLKL